MLQGEVLIGEGVGAVDGVAAGAVEVLEVASLEHELWDDPVEVGALESEAVFAYTERERIAQGQILYSFNIILRSTTAFLYLYIL